MTDVWVRGVNPREDALRDEIERLQHDHEEICNEQKLSENWRTAWMNRTLELEAEQEKMIEVLHRCTLHLEQEAEAELVEDRWQANDAMILCNDIDELFAAHPLPTALRPEALHDVDRRTGVERRHIDLSDLAGYLNRRKSARRKQDIPVGEKQ
jgi:DNA repair ATPase RecN